MSTPILDSIKAEIFGGSAGEKIVIKPSPGGGANHKKINYNSVQKAILNDPDLGNITDKDMAARYSVSRGYAAKIRASLGIVPYLSPKSKRMTDLRKRVLNSPFLGLCRDSDLAEELSTTENYIRSIRKELNIPFCTDRLPSWKSDLLDNWRVIPERVGKSVREWKDYIKNET